MYQSTRTKIHEFPKVFNAEIAVSFPSIYRPRPRLYEMYLQDQDEEGANIEPDEDDDFLHAIKVHPYPSGLGKRGLVPEFVLDKGYLPVVQLGKKEDPIYAFGLGKRNPYTFGLGKRDPYAFGLGKRNPVE